MSEQQTTVAVEQEPDVEQETHVVTDDRAERKKQPRYQVILWDDDDHSFEYVIRMMRRLFGFPLEQGLQIAEEVDTRGRAICLTTTREHAELKRDQIHAFGRDRLIATCQGSMWATIEPVDE